MFREDDGAGVGMTAAVAAARRGVRVCAAADGEGTVVCGQQGLLPCASED